MTGLFLHESFFRDFPLTRLQNLHRFSNLRYNFLFKLLE